MRNRILIGLMTLFLGVLPATFLVWLAVLGYFVSLLALFRGLISSAAWIGVWSVGGILGYIGLIRSSFWPVDAATVGLLACGVLSMGIWAVVLPLGERAFESVQTMWLVWCPIAVGCYHIIVYFRTHAR